MCHFTRFPLIFIRTIFTSIFLLPLVFSKRTFIRPLHFIVNNIIINRILLPNGKNSKKFWFWFQISHSSCKIIPGWQIPNNSKRSCITVLSTFVIFIYKNFDKIFFCSRKVKRLILHSFRFVCLTCFLLKTWMKQHDVYEFGHTVCHAAS